MQNRVGERYLTNEGYWLTIIEYYSSVNCTIQFDDGTILKNKSYCEATRRTIRNPYHKSVFKTGYLGVGKYLYSTHFKTRTMWYSMFNRCYNEKYHIKYPTYIGCEVNKYWHNFQNFGDWFEENWKPYMDSSWCLDKDILVKGNKVYSPETCCFVPNEINSLFTKRQNKRGEYPIGVNKENNKFRVRLNKLNISLRSTPEEAFYDYKIAKEQHIREIADKWKDLIEEKVYQILINYKVEITD